MGTLAGLVLSLGVGKIIFDEHNSTIINKKIINVCTYDFKKADYPNILEAVLGPCIAIGIYDKKTRSGYMIHEPNFKKTDLDAKIREIQSDYGDLSRLKIFVTGNSMPSSFGNDTKESLRANRLFVENLLKKYFRSSHVEIKWTPDDYWCLFSLNTSDGEFKLDVKRD